jgi:hypothetical protein
MPTSMINNKNRNLDSFIDLLVVLTVLLSWKLHCPVNKELLFLLMTITKQKMVKRDVILEVLNLIGTQIDLPVIPICSGQILSCSI